LLPVLPGPGPAPRSLRSSVPFVGVAFACECASSAALALRELPLSKPSSFSTCAHAQKKIVACS
jgi:hypothetical protein